LYDVTIADAAFKKETIMNYPAGINITASVTPEQSGILTPEALAFIAGLARKFEPVRLSLLERRVRNQAGTKRRQVARFSFRDCRRAQRRLDHCRSACRTVGPARRDHPARRSARC